MENKISLQYLLQNGAHIGHHKSRYNPEMSSYILGIRSNIHIIDLESTLHLLRLAMGFTQQVAASGGSVLFICSNPQYSSIVENAAHRCNQPYINKQWIGGLLTNFIHVRKKLESTRNCSNKFLLLTQGIRTMDKLPDAIIVFDVENNTAALREAEKLHIPCIGVVDTNSTIKRITFPIPGNNDSRLTINVYCQLLSNAILSGLRHSTSKN